MNKNKFLKRIFVYKLQYAIAFFVAAIISYGQLFLAGYLKFSQFEWSLPFGIVLFVCSFNTVTYLYSKHLAKKYGADLFGDLDQQWLKEYQGFDSSAFGEIFTRLIQCRKIAGVYILGIISVIWLIYIPLAFFVGVLLLIAYVFYRQTYLDIAIADKVPRSMGGGVVVSRIIDREFTDKIDQLNKNLEKKK